MHHDRHVALQSAALPGYLGVHVQQGIRIIMMDA
jgi:hypothetical protein